MTYLDVVRKAQAAEKSGYGRVQFMPCETWLARGQVSLWVHWQGYWLKDIDRRGVDIPLVGQDWGKPRQKSRYIRRIKEIQSGSEQAHFTATVNLTDKTMAEMFTVFGEDIDITKADPGL